MRGAGRAAALVAVGALLAASCGRGATSTARSGEAGEPRGTAEARQDGSAAVSATPDAEPEPSPPPRGLRLAVASVAPAPPPTVLAFRPGELEPVGRATGARDGAVAFPDLPPGTYRVLVPGDGVHGTADLYVTVLPPDAGPPEPVVVARTRGCPVTGRFRLGESDAGAGPVSGAEVEIVMPDLDQVADRLVVRGRTDDAGELTVLGTCVRGTMEGSVRLPSGGVRAFSHGSLGGGHDRFEILLAPSADGGADRSVGAR